MSIIQKKLDDEIYKVEYQKADNFNEKQLSLLFECLRSIDSDLKPLLNILQLLIERETDEKYRGYMVTKILSFYGVTGQNDLLSIRHKFIVEEGRLVKVPFLKQRQKESINILLEELKRN